MKSKSNGSQMNSPAPLLAGIEELELSVGNPTIVGIHRRRLCPVALADDLDETLADVDLVAEDLAEVAGLGTEDS